MIHVPILRQGKSYESVEKVTLVHHATRAPVARVSMANPGMIPRDVGRMDDRVLERFSVRELLGMCRSAAALFVRAVLPVGEESQSFEDYIGLLSATTGMPVTYCRHNAEKIRKVLDEMETVITGLTRGFDLRILDDGYGAHGSGTLSFYRAGRIFGAVLPSNSPGVHSLWVPAVALKAPLVLKPGREEPWTPLRMIEALAAAGMPREAFGFYPTDHAGAAEVLRCTSRSMLFGDTATTKPWRDDPRVEIHGSGLSKIILGEDACDDWERYLDVMESSIAANGGRSCINASGIWTPRHGRRIAQALAERFARIQALPADDPDAAIAAFANPGVAERISAMIDRLLGEPGAEDVTDSLRGSRVARIGECAYLLPTAVYCGSPEHPLADREFLFPFASVVECPSERLFESIGHTLVATAITGDAGFIGQLMACGAIDRLNIGPVPTWRISWDQPHEGNLFEHLYRQRAFQFQIEPAA